MSWLFGMNKNQPIPEAPQVPVLGGDGGEGSAEGGAVAGESNTGYRSDAYSFDSTALERAAKAAKDLESSKFAKEALGLSQQQEVTRQQEQMVKIKEYEANIEGMKVEQKRVEGEQRRKYLEEENKQAKLKSEYQDQLARRRYEDQLVQQQKMQEENLRKQEESVAK